MTELKLTAGQRLTIEALEKARQDAVEKIGLIDREIQRIKGEATVR